MFETFNSSVFFCGPHFVRAPHMGLRAVDASTR